MGLVAPENILAMYDLKGCEDGREVDLQYNDNYSAELVQKDINFIKNNEHLNLSESQSEKLNYTLKNDTLFLKNLDIMDYSLFIVKINLSSKVQK